MILWAARYEDEFFEEAPHSDVDIEAAAEEEIGAEEIGAEEEEDMGLGL